MLHKVARHAMWAMMALALAGCGAKHAGGVRCGRAHRGIGRSRQPKRRCSTSTTGPITSRPRSCRTSRRSTASRFTTTSSTRTRCCRPSCWRARPATTSSCPRPISWRCRSRPACFQKLDKSLLPNLKNVDPEMAKYFDALDPGMQYAVNYFWGTSGVGYNVDKIKAAMPDAPVDSFRMFFDPTVVKHFKDCGVTLLDAPDEVINTVFVYLGHSAQQRKARRPRGGRENADGDSPLRALHQFLEVHRGSGEWRDLPGAGLERRRGPGGAARSRGQERHQHQVPDPEGGRGAVLRHAGDSRRMPRIRRTRTCSSTTCCGPKSRPGTPAPCTSRPAMPRPIR